VNPWCTPSVRMKDCPALRLRLAHVDRVPLSYLLHVAQGERAQFIESTSGELAQCVQFENCSLRIECPVIVGNHGAIDDPQQFGLGMRALYVVAPVSLLAPRGAESLPRVGWRKLISHEVIGPEARQRNKASYLRPMFK